jgi:hypothetical protein
MTAPDRGGIEPNIPCNVGAVHTWSGKFGQRARLDELALWLQAQLRKISGKAKLAEAIRYALNRMPKARGYLEDGRLELDNNTCERVNGRVKVSQRAAQNVATLGLG